MRNRVARLFLFLFIAGLCCVALAQTDEVEGSYAKLTPEEVKAARAALAEPTPVGALNAMLVDFFLHKENLARKLGDVDALIAIYREWLPLTPDSFHFNGYANELFIAGKVDEGMAMRKESIRRQKNTVMAAFYRLNYVGELFSVGSYDEAKEELRALMESMGGVKASLYKNQNQNGRANNQVILKRTQSGALKLQSIMEMREGKIKEAVEHATQSVVIAREAYQESLNLTVQGEDRQMLTGQSLASSLRTQANALRAAGRYGDAEASLREFLKFTSTTKMPPSVLASLYVTAANLRFDLREFRQAENYYRSADQAAQTQSLAPETRDRILYAHSIVTALEGQQRWEQVFAEIKRIDGFTPGIDPLSQHDFLMARGYAYLHQPALRMQAIQLLTRLSENVHARYPAHHFFVAQADGLLGMALWQPSDGADKTLAMKLLKASVSDYMLPENLDLETAGLGKDIRELVFSTYLDAMFTSPEEEAINAMAPADWIRGGMVQEALSDAAVRSAAIEPGLADLVRKDQDARNEMESLRKFLAGDVGSVNLASADIVRQLHERINTLDGERQKWQQEIKKRFPDYDRLVHPVPPATQDIRAALRPDEALVMLLPTASAVYVWAIASDGKDSAYRVALPREQLNKLITSTRATLDLGEMGDRMLPFNVAASGALYQSLLGTAQDVICSKVHLIVAPGGMLGQIPFAVLLTRPTKQLTADAPWLIRQMAITQIPSLSAWLAVKKFAQAPSASEPLAGWGDPDFGGTRAQAGTSTENRSVVRPTVVREVSQSPHSDDGADDFNYANIPSLPDTRDELLAIALAVHANPESDLHLGAEATKLSVLRSSSNGELQKKRVVVFATHGLVAGDLPNLNQPALALANIQKDGDSPLTSLLTLDEVLQLKLNADWVVLSACNTSAADGKGEEAMSGLARGFFYAGSRSLLVTYWSVDSESAKELTTATFAHHTANPSERKAESLRQAMLKVMSNAEHAHPAFWAPYALVGDGE